MYRFRILATRRKITEVTLDNSKQKNPLLWLISLYGAEGIILNVVTSVIMLYYKGMGVTDTQTAFWTSMLMLPWTFKPLWAPFLELVRSKKRIILTMQALSGVLFIVIAFCLSTPYWFHASIAILFLAAFAGATNDIASDGIYLDSLTAKERESYAGFQSAAWMSGRALSIGGFVWLAGIVIEHLKKPNEKKPNIEAIAQGWTYIFIGIGAFVICVALWHLVFLPKGHESTVQTSSTKEAFSAYVAILKNFFQKPKVWQMIAFVVFYRFSYAHVEKMAPLFLKSKISEGGLGLSEQQFGLIYGTIATIAMLAGSIIGGKLIERFSLKRMILILATLLNVPILLFIYLAWTQQTNLTVLSIILSIELFCSGIGMVGTMTYMMNEVAPGKYHMAHYGISTAIMGVGMMVPGAMSGWVSDHINNGVLEAVAKLDAVLPKTTSTWIIAQTHGYRWFFVYAAGTAIVSFFIARKAPFKDA